MNSSHLLRSVAVLAVALGSTQPAMAQSTTAASESENRTTEQTTEARAQEVDEAVEGLIVVTGSRIRRPEIDAVEPTVSVTRDYIEDRGLTNVADALNEIPGFRGSVTPNGSQGSFGQGVNFINAFGLGSNRTLTLLNGRRVVSSNVASVFGNASGGTQVDLNLIPTILVDRIDRVAIGGAPVYGSDALAGTVNFILDDNYDGVELQANTGITERGDNFRYSLQAAAGTNFGDGRGNVTISGMYENIDGVLQNDRAFYRDNLGFLTNPCSVVGGPCSASNLVTSIRGAGTTVLLNDGRINPNIGFNNSATDGFPGSILVNQVTIPSLSRAGVIANIGALRALDFKYQFDSNSNLIPYAVGPLFGGSITSAAARSSGGDGFKFGDFGQVTSNLRRISTNLFAHYDLTDNMTVFVEGMYFRGRGDELVQQPTFNSTLFGGGSSALTFSVDNPFLSSQARTLLTSNGYSTFRLSRVNLDLSDQTGYSQNDLYRGVVGIRGDFDVGGRSFNYEVSGNYGYNKFIDYNEAINQQNFVNAINVTRNTNGQIVCTATPTVNATPGFTPVADANCQPLNLFGENAASQAALDYIIEDVSARSILKQKVFNLNVGGSPFDMFGNEVAFNIGYEHREESASFSPDSFQAQGLGRSVAIAATSGKYNLDEVFGEVLVPFVTPSNDIFIHRLEAFARGRYVDNTVNGGFFSWAAGGRFAPIKDVEFRGNYTKSFRAPAIVELFAPQTNTFTTVPDLCSTANRNAGPVPTVRAANCAAFLAAFPNATPLAASLATVPGLSGGNPNLDNEVARSYTFGVVLQPSFIPGLSISADYFDINIRNPISSLTVAQITSGCFDNESFNTADPANGNNFCSMIRRDATGQVPADAANPAVTSGFTNGKRIYLSAIQGTMEYKTRLDGIGLPGDFTVAGDLFYTRRRINDITGVAPARSDGTVGDPEFSGQLRLRYRGSKVGFSTNFNYVGEQLISRFNRAPGPNDTREFDQYDDFVTVDASVFFDPTKNFRLTLAVSNLTDRVGQKYYGYIIPGSINDPFGRRFSLTARVRY